MGIAGVANPLLWLLEAVVRSIGIKFGGGTQRITVRLGIYSGAENVATQ